MKDNITKIVYWEEGDCKYDIIIYPEYQSVHMGLLEDFENIEIYEKFVDLARNFVMDYAINGKIIDVMDGVLNDQLFIFRNEADFNRFIMENI